MKREKHTAARRRAAALAHELSAVKTPSLTVKERNSAIRAHVRQALKRHEVQS